MKNLKFISKIVVIFLTISQISVGQKSEDENIKNVLKTSAAAFFKRDFSAWQATYLPNDKSSWTYINHSEFMKIKGYQNLKKDMIAYYASAPAPISLREFSSDNFDIKRNGNLAYVEHDIISSIADAKTTMFGNKSQAAHVRSCLMEDKNEWKIYSLMVSEPDSYTSVEAAQLENNLNGLGYDFLRAKKTNEAIEIFKLSVKYFPDSWNVYDSLADAYEAAGEYKLAIENFEKSMVINPENHRTDKIKELKAK